MIALILAVDRNKGPWKSVALVGAFGLFHSFREFRSDKSPFHGIHPLFHLLFGLACVLSSIAIWMEQNPVSTVFIIAAGILFVGAIAAEFVHAYGSMPERLKTRYQKANPPRSRKRKR